MIEWPAEDKLTDVAKSNMARFRKTAAAKTLEEETTSWRFHAWARQADPPTRMILCNDGGDVLTCTLDPDGRWNLQRKDRE